MSREVRRVAANWQHPKHAVPNYSTGRLESPGLDNVTGTIKGGAQSRYMHSE